MTWHMVSHMVMSMVAPILPAMSAPLTLACGAAIVPSGFGEDPGNGSCGMHAIRPLHHTPAGVLFVFTVGLYGLYYTHCSPG